MYLNYSPLSFCAEIELAKRDERLDLSLLAPRYRETIQRIRALNAKPIRQIRKLCLKGKTPAADDYSEKGVPVVKVATVTINGDLDWEKGACISSALYNESYVTATVKHEDIIVVSTGKGSIGKVAIFTEQRPAIIVGENCLLRCDHSRVDPYYLTAFLLSRYGWLQLDAYPLGPSGQTHLYPHQIDKILVPFLPTSSEIADKYRLSIDLKKQAGHVYAELQDLFDSYIADHYAPTISISTAIPPSECIREKRLDPGFWSNRLAALFTALQSSKQHFVSIRSLAAEPIHRGVQPRYSRVGSIPVIKTVDVQNRKIDWSRCHRVSAEFFEENPRAQLRRGDIVVTSTGEGSWGRAAICDLDRALADSHLTIMRVDSNIVEPYAVLAFLWSEYGWMQFEQRVRGSTGQTEIYPHDIEKIRILVPSDSDQAFVKDRIERQFLLLEKSDSLRKEAIQEIERLLGGAE